MKIAVIGSGAVGCFYGARLARSGQDVHFLMRRDLEAVVQSLGSRNAARETAKMAIEIIEKRQRCRQEYEG